MKRLATALVLVPVVTWLIIVGPQWLFVVSVAVIGLLAFHDYDQLTTGQSIARA